MKIAWLAAWAVVSPLVAQPAEWRFYAADSSSSKYSPLDQITPRNAGQLRVAWEWKSQNFGPRPDTNWEVTPIIVGSTLYFTAGTRRTVVAADAASGETLWMHRIDEGERYQKAVRFNNRGLSYWTDGKGDDRLIVITPGYQLMALNAHTGDPIRGFGTNGLVDLLQNLDRAKAGEIGSTSPAMIVGDVVVVGAALKLGTTPPSKENTPGYVRGFDVRTGKFLWVFHTIAQPGEFGNDTWKDGSWKYTGNTGVWAPMSADQELGYVYLPVETPTGDFYGGHRPGDNLFDESLVCLDAKTGKRVWHFQFIHHGIWDWDLPAAPNLLDLTVDGKKIKAVAQVTKQGWVYTFNRVTGEPVWPIVERPVPQSDVPGEVTSGTQPFPTKPAAFDRQGTSLDILNDLTPEIKAEATRIALQYKLGPIFTPAIVFDAGGKKGTLMLPHATGGANWQGAAADPETGVLYIPSATEPYVAAMVHDPERSDMNYISKAQAAEKPFGLPLIKGPWGRITAIDMNTGEHLWMKPNGEPSDAIKNNPKLKGVDVSQMGSPERGMLLLTKTLLFSGDGGAPFLRVFDKKTGDLLQKIPLPGNAQGTPMTFFARGKQYIVLAVSGSRGQGPELVALTLGDSQ